MCPDGPEAVRKWEGKSKSSCFKEIKAILSVRAADIERKLFSAERYVILGMKV